jgi:hypothetical protein
MLAICSGQRNPVVFVTANGADLISRVPRAIVVDKPFGPASLHSAVDQAHEIPFACPQ